MPKNKQPRRAGHYRVTLGDVLQAHESALAFGGMDGIRDRGLIESAIARPYSGYHRPLHAKAAALTSSLAKTTALSTEIKEPRYWFSLFFWTEAAFASEKMFPILNHRFPVREGFQGQLEESDCCSWGRIGVPRRLESYNPKPVLPT